MKIRFTDIYAGIVVVRDSNGPYINEIRALPSIHPLDLLPTLNLRVAHERIASLRIIRGIWVSRLYCLRRAKDNLRYLRICFSFITGYCYIFTSSYIC
jgi:hypothetical protein